MALNKPAPSSDGHRGTAVQIHERLQVLDPVELRITDDSAHHAGHAGALAGGGHYHVRIVSQRFANLNKVARHRLIYTTLADLMGSAIHALAIEASTPEESLTAR
jgi:BolA protein